MDITTQEVENVKTSLETRTRKYYDQGKDMARQQMVEAIARGDYSGVINYVREYDFAIPDEYLRAAADRDAQRATFHSFNDAIWAYKKLDLGLEAEKIRRSYKYFFARIKQIFDVPPDTFP